MAPLRPQTLCFSDAVLLSSAYALARTNTVPIISASVLGETRISFVTTSWVIRLPRNPSNVCVPLSKKESVHAWRPPLSDMPHHVLSETCRRHEDVEHRRVTKNILPRLMASGRADERNLDTRRNQRLGLWPKAQMESNTSQSSWAF